MSTINGRACVIDGKAVDKVYSNGKIVYGRNLLIGSGISQTVPAQSWGDDQHLTLDTSSLKIGDVVSFQVEINIAKTANLFMALNSNRIGPNGAETCTITWTEELSKLYLPVAFKVKPMGLTDEYTWSKAKAEIGTIATPLTPAPVDKVFSNGKQVYGRNLALGTAKAFTMTGNGSENNANYMYSLSKTIAKGTTITVAFDITSTNATGVYNVRFPGGAWQGSGALPLFSGTQHQSYTLVTDSDYTNGTGIRLDNSTSTINISNFIISESSTEISWTPAPEDVM